MQKIAISKSIGGFSLSIPFAKQFLEVHPELSNHISLEHAMEWNESDVLTWELPRDHPFLIESIETLGVEYVQGDRQIVIVEIPDGIEWHIEENDAGQEWVAENHRTWS